MLDMARRIHTPPSLNESRIRGSPRLAFDQDVLRLLHAGRRSCFDKKVQETSTQHHDGCSGRLSTWNTSASPFRYRPSTHACKVVLPKQHYSARAWSLRADVSIAPYGQSLLSIAISMPAFTLDLEARLTSVRPERKPKINMNARTWPWERHATTHWLYSLCTEPSNL
jgi:hypothetical protein